MATRLHVRQSEVRDLLDQIAGSAVVDLNTILSSINSELTPPGRLIANSPASLVVNIGSGVVTSPGTTRNRSLPQIEGAVPTFTGGTITFPAATGGTITVSPGTNGTLTCPSGQFVKVLVQLNSAGNLSVAQGTPAASAALADVPMGNTSALSLGYIIISNVSGTIQNITNAELYQFDGGGGGGSSNTVQTMAIDNTQTGSFASVTGLIIDTSIYNGFTAQLVVRGLTSVGGGSTWASDGTVNADFQTNSSPGLSSSGTVRAMLRLPDESVILVGSFTTYAGVTVNNIVKISQKGALDTAFQANLDLGAGPNNTIHNISRQSDGKLLVCGAFTQWNGLTRGHVARLNANGTHDTTFISSNNAGFNGNVNAAKQASNGDIICVGSFSSFTDETSTVITAQNIFGLNTNGNYATPTPTFVLPSGGMNNAISDVLVDNTNSAYFVILNNSGANTYGGTSLGGSAAKIDFSGTLSISTYSIPAPWSRVNSLRASLDSTGGLVVAGRWIDTSNSNAAVFIWRFDSSGVSDLTFSPTAEIGSSGFGADIRMDSLGKFIIAGSFTATNPRLMRRYLSTGANDTAFDTILGTGGNGAFALQSCEVGQDDIIYFGGVAGSFTSVNGVAFGSGVVLLGTETVTPPSVTEHYANVPLIGVKKASSTTWEVAQGAGSGSSTGLDFEIDPITGQVRYKVIDPLPGTPSFYTLKYLIKELI